MESPFRMMMIIWKDCVAGLRLIGDVKQMKLISVSRVSATCFKTTSLFIVKNYHWSWSLLWSLRRLSSWFFGVSIPSKIMVFPKIGKTSQVVGRHRASSRQVCRYKRWHRCQYRWWQWLNFVKWDGLRGTEGAVSPDERIVGLPHVTILSSRWIHTTIIRLMMIMTVSTCVTIMITCPTWTLVDRAWLVDQKSDQHIVFTQNLPQTKTIEISGSPAGAKNA